MNGGCSTGAANGERLTQLIPDSPGYVDDALNQVIEKLVTENDGVPAAAGVTPFGAPGSTPVYKSRTAAAAPNYCGPTKATDPEFPGYVDVALGQVINILVTVNNGAQTDVTYPLYGDVSASADATCSTSNINDCKFCLFELQTYVGKCHSYTTGAAYYDGMCSLGFHLSGSQSGG
ncbi:hypothetical protein LINPERHAP1_LOCUS33581 [Linum perenne]